MFNGIFFLTADGPGMNEDVVLFFLHTGKSMISDGKKNVRFEDKESGYAGEITTNFSYGLIGCVGGVIFNTNLESPEGTFRSSFILDSRWESRPGNVIRMRLCKLEEITSPLNN